MQDHTPIRRGVLKGAAAATAMAAIGTAAAWQICAAVRKKATIWL